MPLRTPYAAMACSFVLATTALAQTVVPSRGQTLYELHCIGCHSTQMHWRDRRQATDWPSLKAQVHLWQRNGHLNWTDDDVDDVARFLNATVYRFPQPARPVVQTSPPGPPMTALSPARRN